MVSNSVGVQTGNCSDSFEPLWGEGYSATLRPKDPNQGWLWPAGGILLKEGLFLVLHRMEKRGPGSWDFRVLGSELIRIPDPRAPPSQWEFQRRGLPWSGEDFLVACSPVRHGSKILFFATRWQGKGRGLFLARLEKEAFARLEVDSGWEFWGGARGWTPLLREAEALFVGVGTELSIAEDPQGKVWTCVYSPGGISPQTVLRKAQAPQGPWGAARPLYTCPEAASQKLYCYGAKLHPECASSGLWVTYSVNTTDGTFPGGDTALPRWLLLSAPEP